MIIDDYALVVFGAMLYFALACKNKGETLCGLLFLFASVGHWYFTKSLDQQTILFGLQYFGSAMSLEFALIQIFILIHHIKPIKRILVTLWVIMLLSIFNNLYGLQVWREGIDPTGYNAVAFLIYLMVIALLCRDGLHGIFTGLNSLAKKLGGLYRGLTTRDNLFGHRNT